MMASFLKRVHLRRLRVQVLLWTILPVLIFLIAFSFTGSGSHEQSMRTLVTDENLRLVGAISSAIAARLEQTRSYLEFVAAIPGSSQPTPMGIEQWRVFAGETPPQPLPDWVTSAVERANTEVPSGQRAVPIPDPAGNRVVWTIALPGRQGWLVGSAPMTVFGLDEALVAPHPNAATTVTLVDAAGRVIYGSGKMPAQDTAIAMTGVADALAGKQGVVIDNSSGREVVVAYAPIKGTNWALTIREPLKALTAPLFHFESLLPLILTVGALLSFFTLYFGLRYIARPLQVLAVQATRIGHGDFHAAEMPIGGLDEIEDLRLTINDMAHRIEASQAAMQDYVHTMSSVQDEERARLARELHDETVQSLIALDHKVQMAQRDLDRSQDRCREQLVDMRHMIGAATQEVRRFSQALRPLDLDDLGLRPALEILTSEANAELRVIGTPHRLGDDKELALYRTAQESLNNVRRHAHATRIRCLLHFGVSGVTLAIRDDGIGFDVPDRLTDLTRAGHFGLTGMKKRTELLGGRLDVQSGPGKGTLVVVQVPYAEHPSMDETEWMSNGLATWFNS